MAQYRLSSQVIGRSTGRSVVAAAAYRSGQSLADERTGQVHDFSRKGGILHTEIMAPENAPRWMRDRARLWNAVEVAERRGDAQLAREIQLSLPHELTDAQRLELVRGFVNSQFVARGMIADMAIHAPGKEGDDRNHHAHILLTMRELTGDGFGKKARDWNAKELLQTWRQDWAREQNETLERHGHPSRVDHRSLEVQGIDREPSQHLGPHAHQMEQRGKPSRIGNDNRATDQRNQDRAALRQSAVLVNLDIERHRRQHEAATAQKVHALEDALRLSEIDLARRFDLQRLDLVHAHRAQYGQHEQALRSELAAIDERARSTGWKKVLRTVTGGAARDLRQAESLKATLADIGNRKAEAMQALKVRQDAERRTIDARKVEQVDRLKADLAKQGERREKEIMAAQRKAQWQAERQQKKEARRERAERPVYRRGFELTAEQKEKRIERQTRKYAQDLMRPKLPIRSTTPEPQPVKKDFDEARRMDTPTIPKAPTKEARVSVPAAPAPSPMGEIPRPVPKQVVQVPVKSLPTATQTPLPAPRREFAAKAPAPAQNAPTAPVRAEWRAAAAPAPEKPATPSPAAPTPATPAQAEPPRDRWAEKAKAEREAIKQTPTRDRSGWDFDRER